MFLCDNVLRSDSNEAQKNQIKTSIDNVQNGGWFFRHFNVKLTYPISSVLCVYLFHLKRLMCFIFLVHGPSQNISKELWPFIVCQLDVQRVKSNKVTQNMC